MRAGHVLFVPFRVPRTWQELAVDPAFALVTDLDGTLVPFAVDPAAALPSERVVTVLSLLSALPKT